MITKNSFYGQYLINVTNDKEAADYDISVLSEEVNRAWKVVEELQKEPDRIQGFISAERVRASLFTDDDDEETKPGKSFYATYNVYDSDGNRVNPEDIKPQPFLTAEQKAELKGIMESAYPNIAASLRFEQMGGKKFGSQISDNPVMINPEEDSYFLYLNKDRNAYVKYYYID